MECYIRAAVLPPLTEVRDPIHGAIPISRDELLVLDHPKDDADLAALEVDFQPVQTYPRPGGESWLTVYELETPDKGSD